MTDAPGWTDVRVLVTGAGGFVGSHLAERLATAGARVRALVRYTSTGSRGWLEGSPAERDLEVVPGDVRDPDTLRAAVRETDVVFHLAALIGIPWSYEAPLSYVRTNVEGTVNLLRAALDAGVSRFVQTSTSEVYGSARYVPIDEAHPLQGQSPYSASKIAADHMAEAFHRAYGLPVVTVRPFNVYGPRQSARAVVPTIAVQALAGEVVRLGNLEARRDLTFVEDTVDAFLAAGSRPEAVGGVFNVGTGRDHSVADLVEAVGEAAGRRLRVEVEPRRVRPAASEVDRLCANAERATSVLGWRPKHDLATGLRRTVDWLREHRDRYRADAYAV